MKLRYLFLMVLAFILAACNAPVATLAPAAPTSKPAATLAAPVPTMASAATENDVTSVSSEGYTSLDPVALSTVISPIPTGSITTAEADALLYMREEEKLARDVYMTLFNKWQLAVFQNIANAEQTHTDSVKSLLDRYRLTDPYSTEVGVFTNQDLQNLYDKLVTQGSQSVSDALKVGGAIEEIDILDLEERIAQTDKADIILVYENLMKGSRNHLRSFVSTLKTQTGEIYQPQYLNQDAYQTIVNSSIENGGQGGKGSGNGKP